jgi:hypothetical protein
MGNFPQWRVELTGRNLVQVDALSIALADITYRTLDLDFTVYKDYMIILSSTITALGSGVSLRLTPYINGETIKKWDGTAWTGIGEELYANGQYLLTTKLDIKPAKSLRLKYRADSVPDAGSVVVTVWGVPN